jgi:hypothetical protein
MLALGVRAGAELVDGGVPDDPITVAQDLVAGVRAAGPNDAQAMSRCIIQEPGQLGTRDFPARVTGQLHQSWSGRRCQNRRSGVVYQIWYQ